MWEDILVLKLICLENKPEIGKAFNSYDLEVVITLMFFSDHLELAHACDSVYTSLQGWREWNAGICVGCSPGAQDVL